MKATSYILLVVTLAVASACTVWNVVPPEPGWNLTTIALLAAFALTAELVDYLLPRGATGSVAFVPYMAAIQLVPNFSAIVAIVFTRVFADIIKRREARKKLFNAAQLFVSYGGGLLIYRWLGGGSLYDYTAAGVASATTHAGLPLIAAYSFTVVANTFLVCGIIAITANEPLLKVWKENNLLTIGIDILASPLVFAFAWAYASYGPLIAGLLWVPVLGLRQMNTINLELAQTNRELLELMVKSIEARDPYTSGHSRRVREYAVRIAQLMNLSAGEVEKIGTAALLHDVGKIFDKYAPILAKEDRLTPEEWSVIKEHPADGADLIATMTTLRHLIPSVRHHHENWDGSGYPDGLKGETIPLASRVIMFADTLDAMTTQRPYRGPLGEVAVRDELRRCKGKQFDPSITDSLLQSNFWGYVFPPSGRAQPSELPLRLVSKPKTERSA